MEIAAFKIKLELMRVQTAFAMLENLFVPFEFIVGSPVGLSPPGYTFMLSDRMFYSSSPSA